MSKVTKVLSFGGGVVAVGLIQAEPIAEAQAQTCESFQLVSSSEKVNVLASEWDADTTGAISLTGNSAVSVPRLDFHSLRNDGTDNDMFLTYFPGGTQVSMRGCKNGYLDETWTCTGTVSETVAFSSSTLDSLQVGLDGLADAGDHNTMFYTAEVWGSVHAVKGIVFTLNRSVQENTLRSNLSDYISSCVINDCW